MGWRGRPGFSADGRHLFFKGTRGARRRNHRQFIVCDGVEGPAHAVERRASDAVWIPKDFRNYPKRLRYVVRDKNHVRLVEFAWPGSLTWKDAIEDAPAPTNRPATRPTRGPAQAPWGKVSNGLQCRLLPATQTVKVPEGQKPKESKVFVTSIL